MERGRDGSLRSMWRVVPSRGGGHVRLRGLLRVRCIPGLEPVDPVPPHPSLASSPGTSARTRRARKPVPLTAPILRAAPLMLLCQGFVEPAIVPFIRDAADSSTHSQPPQPSLTPLRLPFREPARSLLVHRRPESIPTVVQHRRGAPFPVALLAAPASCVQWATPRPGRAIRSGTTSTR